MISVLFNLSTEKINGVLLGIRRHRPQRATARAKVP